MRILLWLAGLSAAVGLAVELTVGWAHLWRLLWMPRADLEDLVRREMDEDD